MRKHKLRKIITGVVIFLLALIVGLPWQTVTPTPAFTASASSAVNQFDSTHVIEDLGADVVSQYEAEAGAEPQLYSFMEYMYSENVVTRQTHYGLYIYLYNPSQTVYSTTIGASVVNMAVSYNAAGAPDGYANLPLKNCGYTTGKYDKLFYKFRVMNIEQVLENAATLQESSGYRRYDLVSIQLRSVNSQTADDYGIAKTFHYTGYSKGCDESSETESTLVCKDAQMETLSLNVHPTAYRPEGNNGKNEYTQDSLHSVWFSVPNEIIDKYGDMYAVHATWLNAVLKPALVTGNLDAYNAIKEYLGQYDEDGYIEDLPYFYGGDYERNTPAADLELVDVDTATDFLGSSYNAPTYWLEDDILWQLVMHKLLHSKAGYLVNPLYLLFYSGSAENSADNYYVSSETIISEMVNMTASIGGDLVKEYYSRELFGSVADELSEVNYTADDDLTSDEYFGALTSRVIDKNWWQEHLGLSGDVTETLYDGIYAIREVTAADVNVTSAGAAQNLYINENDFADLKSDVTAAQSSNETVYLYRYQISDYFSQEATLFKRTDKNAWLNDDYYWEEVDTNAYFFTETVNLDFEIIDVTFKKDEVKTVIPVVMSPIDIVPSSSPPIETTTDEILNDRSWWKIALVAIGGFVLVVFIYKIFMNFRRQTVVVKQPKNRRRK